MVYSEQTYTSVTELVSAGTRAPRIRSLAMLRPGHTVRRIAIALTLLLVAVTLGLVFIPWQQSITGNGRVMILSPMQRPQNVEARIPGRIVSIKVQEGQIVKANDLIAELEDIDSKFLDLDQSVRLQTQREFQLAKRDAAEARAAALEEQIAALTRSRAVAVPAAQERARQTIDRRRAAEQTVRAAEQGVTTAELNVARIRDLHDKGLRSRRDLEVAELDIVRARTEAERALAATEVARGDVRVGDLDQAKVVADTSAAINSLQASLASVRESVAAIGSDIQKLDVEIGNVGARGVQREVRSPSDGQIVRLAKFGSGTTVKAGDPIAVIAPTTSDLAVEIYVSDNDAPLVAPGRHVRLQFAGFPAIQFSGFPSIAVGTFGGRVAVVDPVDDGKNQFRVIVVPDEETVRAGKDEPWTIARGLRPGAEATGWIMLDEVRLGFELWRQFNAFPPSVRREPLDKKDKPKDEKKLGEELDDSGFFKSK